jgi:succinate-semialdehyde dehydrogenase/glutarate-semialdehyde dehydrogenase
MSDLISINPINNSIVGTYPQHTNEEINKIIYKVNDSFNLWRRLNIEQRGQYFKQLSITLKSRKNEFAKIMALEMGKPILQGEAEVEKSAWVCDYYADNAPNFLSTKEVKSEASESYISFQPLGVVFAVMPWNFPFWQVFRFAAPAMIAGNVAILKHSSNVQGCADAIEGLFLEVAFPNNVFRNLTISSSKVGQVIENSMVKAITLTGSTPAGKAVAKKAGSVLKKTVLELGGSDPYIVLKDSDLEIATDACLKGRLLNTGQSCIAAKRFIIEESIKSDFENIIIDKIKEQIIGDPFDERTTIGPMVSIEARDQLKSQVEATIDAGASLLYKSLTPSINNSSYHPVIVLTNVLPGMPAFDEELFGPVLSIISAKDKEHAITLANQSCFGLGAAIFTSDIDEGRRIAEFELEAGAGFVNDFVRSDPRLPFGGVKESGYGNELSSYGILEFVNIKTIYIR